MPKGQMKQFELWRAEGNSIALTVCEIGPEGEACRNLLEPNAEIIWTFEGYSHIDTMQKYYDYMDWGIYKTDWPELDSLPYHYTKAMATLERLPATLKPLTQITRYADGHTKPDMPSPMAVITIQDRKVFSVGIWIRGDFGGHEENPVNINQLKALVEEKLRVLRPGFLKRVKNLCLICPHNIAAQMIWPSHGRDPEEIWQEKINAERCSEK
jgi:hypothetical protein